jgi:hypothetical protein
LIQPVVSSGRPLIPLPQPWILLEVSVDGLFKPMAFSLILEPKSIHRRTQDRWVVGIGTPLAGNSGFGSFCHSRIGTHYTSHRE